MMDRPYRIRFQRRYRLLGHVFHEDFILGLEKWGEQAELSKASLKFEQFAVVHALLSGEQFRDAFIG